MALDTAPRESGGSDGERSPAETLKTQVERALQQRQETRDF